MSTTITLTLARPEPLPVAPLPPQVQNRAATFADQLQLDPRMTAGEQTRLAAWRQQFADAGETPYLDIAELYAGILAPAMERDAGLEEYQTELLGILQGALPPGWTVEQCLATYAVLNEEFEQTAPSVMDGVERLYEMTGNAIHNLTETRDRDGNALAARAHLIDAQQREAEVRMRAAVVTLADLAIGEHGAMQTEQARLRGLQQQANQVAADRKRVCAQAKAKLK